MQQLTALFLKYLRAFYPRTAAASSEKFNILLLLFSTEENQIIGSLEPTRRSQETKKNISDCLWNRTLEGNPSTLKILDTQNLLQGIKSAPSTQSSRVSSSSSFPWELVSWKNSEAPGLSFPLLLILLLFRGLSLFSSSSGSFLEAE